jgi:hypothetical protein
MDLLEMLITGFVAIQVLIALAPLMSTPEFLHSLSLLLKFFGF